MRQLRLGLIIFLVFISSSVVLGGRFGAVGTVDTTDISYILPGGGHFDNASSNAVWCTYFPGNATPEAYYADNSVYFVYDNTSSGNSYVALHCYGKTISCVSCPARIGVINLDISKYKRTELLVTITFRGSTTYDNANLYEWVQPEVNSAYFSGGWGGPRSPGVSPGYLEAVSFKGESVDTTQNTFKFRFAYGKLMQAPDWVTFKWHILPISQDYFKIGYFGIKYHPNDIRFNKLGPPNDTELQIKEIKLQLLNRHYH